MKNLSTIRCPICGAGGSTLRHDVRCSLLYFCERCEHEWQIELEDEPSASEPLPQPAAALSAKPSSKP